MVLKGDTKSWDVDVRTTKTFSGATKKYIAIGVLALTATLGAFTAKNIHNIAAHPNHQRQSLGKFSDVHNETLGFQKVFALNLPERSDKRDGIAMAARLTNFSVEFIDGVRGSAMSPEALPYKSHGLKNGTIGCWRGHADVMAKIVRENIQSALIFEDDADWDIGFKSQLEELARGSRWLLEEDADTTLSPYGDKWDLLHIGHCHSQTWPSDNKRWVIPRDPTVPPNRTRWDFGGPDMANWETGAHADSQVRIVHTMRFGVCRSAYAVTKRSAQKFLHEFSLRSLNTAGDLRMGQLCSRVNFPNFNCIAPFPRLVGKAVAAGSNLKASDINSVNGDRVNEHTLHENVMFSVRHNAERILKGETVFKSYFRNPSGNELTLEEITSARGHPEII